MTAIRNSINNIYDLDGVSWHRTLTLLFCFCVLLQISYIEMAMPNIHYFTVNMAPFGLTNKDEVYNKFNSWLIARESCVGKQNYFHGECIT